MPYVFGRTVRVAPTGEVVMDYEVRNDARERMPYIWSSHPLLPLGQLFAQLSEASELSAAAGREVALTLPLRGMIADLLELHQVS